MPEPSLRKFKESAQVTQPDLRDPAAHALTNIRASLAARPDAPMALQNGEQMSHNNHSLLVAISWARQTVAKENKGLFSPPAKPHRASFPSSYGLIQRANGQGPVTSLSFSPDFRSGLFKEKSLPTHFGGHAPAVSSHGRWEVLYTIYLIK